MKTMLQMVMILGAIILVGCRTVKIETQKTTTVIHQEPVVAPDQELKGK